MLKTKIDIVKWIKNNFENEQDFKDFLEYDYLNQFVESDRKLSPQYQEEYNNLKLRWEKLHNTIKNMPEIKIVERFGKETHITMRTPLNYMNYYYYCDAQKRSKLFQKNENDK